MTNSITPNGPTDGAVRRSLGQRILAWFIADDPHPEYSRLDRMDGLGKSKGREFIVTSDDGLESRPVREAMLDAAARGIDVDVLVPKTGIARSFTPADVFEMFGAPAGSTPTA